MGLADDMLTTVAAGVHRFALYSMGGTPAKVSFACCDWPEDFTTAFPIPEADCPYCGTRESFAAYSSHFFETKTMTNYSGFPAMQDCAINSGPPAGPSAAQCPPVQDNSGGTMATQPESC